jgi:hypothetical protein
MAHLILGFNLSLPFSKLLPLFPCVNVFPQSSLTDVPEWLRFLFGKTRGLDFEHMIKGRAHKGGVRIGKTPKKLASICCPQHRESKADNLKATEANRRRGPGTRQKVRSKRINLEGNTNVQEINVSQLPV